LQVTRRFHRPEQTQTPENPITPTDWGSLFDGNQLEKSGKPVDIRQNLPILAKSPEVPAI